MAMKYYIDTIEQVKGEAEGTFNEYGKREIQTKKDDSGQTVPKTLNEVVSAYHIKLGNVANDMVEDGGNHYYMDIKITNSKGGTEKRDELGKYVEQ